MDNISNGPVTPEEEARGEALPTRDECNLAVLCQLLQFAGLIIPFGSLLAPLILWLVKRSESAFLDEIGKEVINFEISLLIYSLICGLLIFVIIGFFMLAVLGLGTGADHHRDDEGLRGAGLPLSLDYSLHPVRAGNPADGTETADFRNVFFRISGIFRKNPSL